MKINSLFKVWLILISAPSLTFISLFPSAAAESPEIWLSPTEEVTQHGSDFHEFFLHPEQWGRAAAKTARFSVAVRYLLAMPPETVARELQVLHDLGIRLDVAVPALPVDKHVCGEGIEGMVWPGEPTDYSIRLKALGVDVYSFSLDLPLTSGYRNKSSQSCRFSIRETAERTARATTDILAVYPNAKVVDIEVPTGMLASEWSSMLREWIDAYRRASGRNFDGLMMDAWWQFDWRSAALETARVLDSHHIPLGIGINASGINLVPANQWVTTAKKNACALRAARIPLNFLGVSNWQNMHVHGLPESDPATLTGLVVWLANGHRC